MSVIGIVGEYNPMHYGHLHHIAETKRLMGEDCPVVCVMSGDFIQRGEGSGVLQICARRGGCDERR